MYSGLPSGPLGSPQACITGKSSQTPALKMNLKSELPLLWPSTTTLPSAITFSDTPTTVRLQSFRFGTTQTCIERLRTSVWETTQERRSSGNLPGYDQGTSFLLPQRREHGRGLRQRSLEERSDLPSRCPASLRRLHHKRRDANSCLFQMIDYIHFQVHPFHYRIPLFIRPLL
jgi:hypothetical protein